MSNWMSNTVRKFHYWQRKLSVYWSDLPSAKPVVKSLGLLVGLILLWQAGRLAYAYLLEYKPYVDSYIDPLSQLDNDAGRVNWLVLGVGGQQHEGGDLTDSIIFISVDFPREKISIMSLPRDIWIPGLQAKINAAYVFGEQEGGPAGGMVMAKQAVSQVVGQPVHYGVKIDFGGFVRLVDLLGGIEVDVEQGFVDDRFPIPGKENAYPESERYERIEFKPGRQWMDGETALKYVRSRHAKGEQGTDIARSQRQKQVLKAIRAKLLADNWLINPAKANQLLSLARETVVTDLPLELWPSLIKVAQKFSGMELISIDLPVDIGDGRGEPEKAVFIHPTDNQNYGFQWVLIPKDNDWDRVHQVIDCQLNYLPVDCQW